MTDLWIEKVDRGRDAVAFRICGCLVGSAVDALERECSNALCRKPRPALTLELSELKYVSSAGARLLRDLRRRGLTIRGLTPLFCELLEDSEG